MKIFILLIQLHTLVVFQLKSHQAYKLEGRAQQNLKHHKT